jgi:hypothetical protein
LNALVNILRWHALPVASPLTANPLVAGVPIRSTIGRDKPLGAWRIASRFDRASSACHDYFVDALRAQGSAPRGTNPIFHVEQKLAESAASFGFSITESGIT